MTSPVASAASRNWAAGPSSNSSSIPSNPAARAMRNRALKGNDSGRGLSRSDGGMVVSPRHASLSSIVGGHFAAEREAAPVVGAEPGRVDNLRPRPPHHRLQLLGRDGPGPAVRAPRNLAGRFGEPDQE